MNPTVATYLMRLMAAAIEAKASGVPAELKADLDALIAEGKDSILEAQDDGEPWTDDAILSWKAAHDALLAGIRTRHSR
jgi:hypothetical protein